jgi:hypothetical protein
LLSVPAAYPQRTRSAPFATIQDEIPAEGVGFEPTMGFPIPVFKTGALGRSAIPPEGKPLRTHLPAPQLGAPHMADL